MNQILPQFRSANRAQLQAHLVQKAASDPAFRASLLENPKAAIQEETGLQIPASISVSALEETANKLCFVLPASAGELSDLELEAVAGGSGSSVLGGRKRLQLRPASLGQN